MKGEMEVETLSVAVLDSQKAQRVRERKASIMADQGQEQMALFGSNEHRSGCDEPAVFPCD